MHRLSRLRLALTLLASVPIACGERGAAVLPSGQSQELPSGLEIPSAGKPMGSIPAADINDSGLVALLDGENSKVLLFDQKGGFLRSFGRDGQGPGEFRAPHLIAIAPDGDVLVGDIGNSRVSRWDVSGRLLATTVLPTPAIAIAWTDSGFAIAIERGIGRIVYRLSPREGGVDSLVTVARIEVADPFKASRNAVTCLTCSIAITTDLRLLVSAPDTIYRVALTDLSGRVVRTWRRTDVAAIPASMARRERAMRLIGIRNPGDLPAAISFRPSVRTIGLDRSGQLITLRFDPDTLNANIDIFAASGVSVSTFRVSAPVTRIIVDGGFLGVIHQDSMGFSRLRLVATQTLEGPK